VCAHALRRRYLVLFLKFIASVVPTIQYDYTMPVGGAA
jgi:ubiquitin-like-conjugating enzyme ATG3